MEVVNKRDCWVIELSMSLYELIGQLGMKDGNANVLVSGVLCFEYCLIFLGLPA